MMWHSEWSALSRRISGLLEAAKFHISCRVPGSTSNDVHGVAPRELLPVTAAIFRDLEALRERHLRTLPAAARAALDRFVETSAALFAGTDDRNDVSLHFRVTALVALEAEVSYHLTDFPARARRLSERAFSHLQRCIVADPDTARRWRRAFRETGETACERLGAAHLLFHGIWAFKANTAGERTDLVLGDILLNRMGEVEEVAEALVLTEWKKVARPGDLPKAQRVAHTQAKLYAGSSLAGLELDAYRYLVLVTRTRMEMPPDFDEAGVQYRHINIAVSPLSPSRTARQRRPRPGPA